MTAKDLLKRGVRIERNKTESHRAPAYEAWAPNGLRFSSGQHSILAWDRKDLLIDLDGQELVPCSKNCECGEGK